MVIKTLDPDLDRYSAKNAEAGSVSNESETLVNTECSIADFDRVRINQLGPWIQICIEEGKMATAKKVQCFDLMSRLYSLEGSRGFLKRKVLKIFIVKSNSFPTINFFLCFIQNRCLDPHLDSPDRKKVWIRIQ